MAKSKRYEFISKLRSALNKETERMLNKQARYMAKRVGCGAEEYKPQFAFGINFCAERPFHLSIQASGCHYCTPRITMPYKYYEAFEVAICDDGKMVSAQCLLGGGDELAEELDKYFGGSVFGYVPAELVERLYQRCKKQFGLIEVQ